MAADVYREGQPPELVAVEVAEVAALPMAAYWR